jgi:hypothetical protein
MKQQTRLSPPPLPLKLTKNTLSNKPLPSISFLSHTILSHRHLYTPQLLQKRYHHMLDTSHALSYTLQALQKRYRMLEHTTCLTNLQVTHHFLILPKLVVASRQQHARTSHTHTHTHTHTHAHRTPERHSYGSNKSTSCKHVTGFEAAEIQHAQTSLSRRSSCVSRLSCSIR